MQKPRINAFRERTNRERTSQLPLRPSTFVSRVKDNRRRANLDKNYDSGV